MIVFVVMPVSCAHGLMMIVQMRGRGGGADGLRLVRSRNAEIIALPLTQTSRNPMAIMSR